MMTILKVLVPLWVGLTALGGAQAGAADAGSVDGGERDGADAGSALPVRLRLRAGGDVMMGTSFPEGHLPPEDGEHLLDAVAPIIADSDLTFVNLEGPLCDHGETKKCKRSKNCYAFRSPTRYGRYLQQAGVDVVSTANNHSGDFGELCRRETESTLDALGIAWSGPPGSVATVQRSGLNIGLVAFHTSGACNDVNDRAGELKLIRAAKANHDLVVVSFHGGAEGARATHVIRGAEKFHGENRGDLTAFAHAAIDAGADLVLGHGPHVVRAIEFYRSKMIAYSMGNFATYGRFDLGGRLARGMVLEVELGADGAFLGGRVIPTRQRDRGIPELDPDGPLLAELRALTLADFPGSGAKISPEGQILPP